MRGPPARPRAALGRGEEPGCPCPDVPCDVRRRGSSSRPAVDGHLIPTVPLATATRRARGEGTLLRPPHQPRTRPCRRLAAGEARGGSLVPGSIRGADVAGTDTVPGRPGDNRSGGTRGGPTTGLAAHGPQVCGKVWRKRRTVSHLPPWRPPHRRETFRVFCDQINYSLRFGTTIRAHSSDRVPEMNL